MKKSAPANGTKDVDWVKVEVHYRAGIRTTRDIGAEFGVSHGRISQKAKELGWIRDLAGKIRAAAQAKIEQEVAREAVKQEALTNPAIQADRRLTESQVVDANAESQVAVIRGHKRGLARLARMRDKLLDELDTMTEHAEVLHAFVDDIDESGPTPSGHWKTDRKAEMMRAILEAPERAKTLKVLSEVDERIRKGEREAYGIDKVKEEKSGIEELLDRVSADLKAKAAA